MKCRLLSWSQMRVTRPGVRLLEVSATIPLHLIIYGFSYTHRLPPYTHTTYKREYKWDYKMDKSAEVLLSEITAFRKLTKDLFDGLCQSSGKQSLRSPTPAKLSVVNSLCWSVRWACDNYLIRKVCVTEVSF